MKKEFDVYEYVSEKATPQVLANHGDEMQKFAAYCDQAKKALDDAEKEESKANGQESLILERQRNAILGLPKEVRFYKQQIKDIIKEMGIGAEWYPHWYDSMEDAIYNEILGFAGLAPWIENRKPEYQYSSSAKMIGGRIYFMIGGKLELQPQSMTSERRAQLRAALLLDDPRKRLNEVYHEVYLQDGSRVTIYNEGLAKRGQDCIVFRKFVVQNYSFEMQAEKHTIPAELVPVFKAMVKVGYNVAFVGPVRSAKTTFLTTWQSYEDDSLEGVQVESDPEIPLHEIMPNAPIMQFVPNEDDLRSVIKRIMRSDADYIIMAEARDGVALHTAVKAANKGTRRVKMTFHTTDVIDFAYDVAEEIINSYPNMDLGSYIIKTAKSFDYILQFAQLEKNKSEKRLIGMWEMRYDLTARTIHMLQICKYDYDTDAWTFAFDIGEDKRQIGHIVSPKAFAEMENILRDLSQKYPMQGNYKYVPFCQALLRG
ncbi:MAG: ATPase, T2SS/T4P/T4SS family [Eubacteriales bacterium]|nr:ATPase, T2SS/T4P/T4SS family [Eubacteriales bacterium]